MTDALVAVVFVAERSFLYFLIRKGLSKVDMDVPLLLHDALDNAFKVLGLRFHVLLGA